VQDERNIRALHVHVGAVAQAVAERIDHGVLHPQCGEARVVQLGVLLGGGRDGKSGLAAEKAAEIRRVHTGVEGVGVGSGKAAHFEQNAHGHPRPEAHLHPIFEGAVKETPPAAPRGA